MIHVLGYIHSKGYFYVIQKSKQNQTRWGQIRLIFWTDLNHWMGVDFFFPNSQHTTYNLESFVGKWLSWQTHPENGQYILITSFSSSSSSSCHNNIKKLFSRKFRILLRSESFCRTAPLELNLQCHHILNHKTRNLGILGKASESTWSPSKIFSFLRMYYIL